MGKYTTEVTTNVEYKQIISLLRDGYVDNDGKKHRPNKEVATILVLECNLGCRLSDIISLTTDSIKDDNGIYKLDIVERKTKKKRTFVVPAAVVDYIEEWKQENEITEGNLFHTKEANVWYALRLVTSHLGLANTSSHSMRKMAAQTLYEQSGYDVALVSQWLQHSNIATTSHYLRRNSRQMEQAIQGMVNLA